MADDTAIMVGHFSTGFMYDENVKVSVSFTKAFLYPVGMPLDHTVV